MHTAQRLREMARELSMQADALEAGLMSLSSVKKEKTVSLIDPRTGTKKKIQRM
jgi:hypothetical protein